MVAAITLQLYVVALASAYVYYNQCKFKNCFRINSLKDMSARKQKYDALLHLVGVMYTKQIICLYLYI